MSELNRKGFKLPHAGPYVVKITNYADPTYMGAYEGIIEQGLVTNPELKSSTVLIHYLPPFYGVTSSQFEGNDATSFNDVQKSYGMWMAPPDLHTRVLCMFVESDSNQGYWIGCIPDRWQNHMIPGIAISSNVAWGPGQKEKYGNVPVPVAEFLKKDRKNIKPNAEPKPVHPFADRLLKQGLLADKYRGSTTSSARRDMPSQVFGISTPGPLDPKGPKQTVGYEKKVTVPVSRLGGHTFVMDDGDVLGENRLVRLRSSAGHQILLNDTANILYIANADGTAWFEMTASGKIDVYAKDSVSIHTEADFNFKADRDFNLEAGRNVNIRTIGSMVFNIGKNYDLKVINDVKVASDGTFNQFSRGKLNMTTADTFNLYSTQGLNLTGGSGGINLVCAGGKIKTIPGIFQNDKGATVATPASDALTVTKLGVFSVPSTDTTAGWGSRYQGAAIPTILQRVPMHEPWLQHESYAPNKFSADATDVSCANITPSAPSAPSANSGNNTASTNTGTTSSPANKKTTPLNPKTPADWTKDVDFLSAVQNLAGKLNCDFYDLLAVMYLETDKSMAPNKPSGASSAVGLIQFIPGRAREVGSSTDQLAAMTRVEQMVFVEKYFNLPDVNLKRVKSPGINDLYMAIFAPAAIGKPDDFPLYTKANSFKNYSANFRYDLNRDGIITRAEACSQLQTFKTLVKKKMGV
jgi:hypothetical protein